MSEGFIKAGFTPVAHIEMDKNACLSLKTRISYHYLKSQDQLEIYYSYLRQNISQAELYSHVPSHLLKSAIQAEISDLSIKNLFDRIDNLLNGGKIDLIVGGPPCQAYSLVGRSKINSLGDQHVSTDIRYELYKQYGRFLQKYQPEYFVFENVLGLRSAEKGQLLLRIKKYFEKECGYKIDWRIVNAYEYGVLQLRKRIIIIGKRGLDPFEYPEFERVRRENSWNVKESLFSDLEPLSVGEEKHYSLYKDLPVNSYLQKHGIRSEVNFVTQHITRPHNSRDLAIYRLAIEKWEEGERLKYPDLPEELRTHRNLTSFLDRYKVVDPDGLCHTVVAHIARDGHYYIYPDKNQTRSLSVREAARIQSFPDDYFFEGGRGAAFKQIGNAVPPQLAFVIARKMKELLLEKPVNEFYLHPYTTSPAESVGAH